MKNVTTIWIGRLVLACLLVSLAVPMIQWTFHSQMGWHALWVNYVSAIAYALCIGSALWFLIGGTWCSLSRLPAVFRWMIRVAFVAAGTAAGCFVAGLVVWIMHGRSYAFWPDFVGSFKIGLVLSAFATAFMTFYENSRAQLQTTEAQLKTKELERERALKLATEARLASLESRIHPHFLFNTINSVSSLIHEEPDRAERILNQMAELLRFSLDSTQQGLVPLARELKVVEDYLEIEKARFGDRLRYEIVAPEALHSLRVPPLSLQTLVENSVKYAVSARRKGATLYVNAEARNGALVLEVIDDGPGFPHDDLPAGHGLSNLQERLTALFGLDAALRTVSTPGGATVTIEFPLPRITERHDALFSDSAEARL